MTLAAWPAPPSGPGCRTPGPPHSHTAWGRGVRAGGGPAGAQALPAARRSREAAAGGQPGPSCCLGDGACCGLARTAGLTRTTAGRNPGRGHPAGGDRNGPRRPGRGGAVRSGPRRPHRAVTCRSLPLLLLLLGPEPAAKRQRRPAAAVTAPRSEPRPAHAPPPPPPPIGYRRRSAASAPAPLHSSPGGTGPPASHRIPLAELLLIGGYAPALSQSGWDGGTPARQGPAQAAVGSVPSEPPAASSALPSGCGASTELGLGGNFCSHRSSPPQRADGPSPARPVGQAERPPAGCYHPAGSSVVAVGPWPCLLPSGKPLWKRASTGTDFGRDREEIVEMEGL